MGRLKVRRLGTLCAPLLAALAIGMALAGAQGAQIAGAQPVNTTFVVTNTNDSGSFSLRQAIANANAAGGVNTITFNLSGCPCAISPLTALPPITRALTILGPGASMLAINGNNQTTFFRVLDIVSVTATIADLTVQNGRAGSGDGGGVRSTDALTLSNVNVFGNRSDGQGGGASAITLTAINTQFFNNRASFAGGGFSAQNAVISSTSVISNLVLVSGGGGQAANLTAINSQFLRNRANSGQGGGLVVTYGLGAITNTKFISNAANFGGAIYATGPRVSIVDSLFSDNVEVDAFGHGGALDLSSNTTSIENSRFTGNQTAGTASAIFEAGGTLRVVNSLFAGNITTGTSSSTLEIVGSGNATILHSTIAQVVTSTDSAVSLGNLATAGISDTIIASYTVGIKGNAGSVYVSHNLFFGNGLDMTGTISSGGGNVFANPRFVNPAAGDYHLSAGSPAIDAGIFAGVLSDLEHHNRPACAVDIGAYEFAGGAVCKLLYLPLVRR